MGIVNTQLPERDKDVITFAQFDGLRNDITPERFELGDLDAASNVDLDETGRIARRQGYTSAVAGAAHSLWADDLQDVCLFVASSTLRRLHLDMSATDIQALRDGTAPMACCRVSDRVYFSNGTDIGILAENGAARAWGLPVPPLPGAVATSGMMPAGTYQFVATWGRADGQESGCGLAGTIDLATGSGIQFTLPPAPPEAAISTLYLSPASGDVLYEAVSVPAGQASLTWQADPANLSMPLETQFFGPPPAGQLLAHYRGHMLVAVGDTLYVSKSYGYELFDLRRYMQLDGRITMLAPLVDKDRTDDGRDSGFFIGTDRSMGVLAGSDPDSFQYVPKVNYGAIAGSLCYADATVLKDGANGARMLPMWMSAQGICVGLPDLQINNLTRARYNLTVSGRGAAVFMPDPNRFIATANL